MTVPAGIIFIMGDDITFSAHCPGASAAPVPVGRAVERPGMLSGKEGRGIRMSRERKTADVLRSMYNLEVMATEIYRTQQGAFSSPEEKSLMKDAAENEKLHRESFRRLLEQRGGNPTAMRHLFRFAGQLLGRTTSLLGRGMVLRADAAFEKKAFGDYGKFLATTSFSEEEKDFVERFRDDERRHMENWKGMLTGAARH